MFATVYVSDFIVLSGHQPLHKVQNSRGKPLQRRRNLQSVSYLHEPFLVAYCILYKCSGPLQIYSFEFALSINFFPPTLKCVDRWYMSSFQLYLKKKKTLILNSFVFFPSIT